MGPIGYSWLGAAITSSPLTPSSKPMGDRLSRLTCPVTASAVSWARWSALRNSSSGTSLKNITHWRMPVPSRSWRKWSLPDERLA